MMAAVATFELDYAFGETRMRGCYACAEDVRSRPGLLIIPDAFGLDSYCIEVAGRLAAMGYAALAADLWGERRRLAGEAAGAAVGELARNRDDWMGRVAAAHEALTAQPGVDPGRIGALGYCLGGSTALEYARTGGDLKALVSFHGGLDLVGDDWSAAADARLLLCTGIEDPLVPWSAVTAFQETVRKAGVRWELDVYSHAKHSFTRPDALARSSADRVGYDAWADGRSWRTALDFLQAVLEPDLTLA